MFFLYDFLLFLYCFFILFMTAVITGHTQAINRTNAATLAVIKVSYASLSTHHFFFILVRAVLLLSPPVSFGNKRILLLSFRNFFRS